MFEFQPDKKTTCVMAADVTKMTPLHKAALFDRVDCIKYLLDQVSIYNVLGIQDQTSSYNVSPTKSSAAQSVIIPLDQPSP